MAGTPAGDWKAGADFSPGSGRRGYGAALRAAAFNFMLTRKAGKKLSRKLPACELRELSRPMDAMAGGYFLWCISVFSIKLRVI
jgi:hypothetical protein